MPRGFLQIKKGIQKVFFASGKFLYAKFQAVASDNIRMFGLSLSSMETLKWKLNIELLH